MKWMSVALLTASGIVSAQAYTCADVRALTAEQQAYYIKVFNITPAQQERIRHACYGTKSRHGAPISVEASAGRSAHEERDARAEQ
jgi:hypothetical protein